MPQNIFEQLKETPPTPNSQPFDLAAALGSKLQVANTQGTDSLQNALALSGPSGSSRFSGFSGSSLPEDHQSYLEALVDKATSLAISDKDTRHTVDHYSCEFLTTAALFAGGRAGLAATALLYGLNSTNTDSTLLDAAEDFVLGAAKGLGTRAVFDLAGKLPTAPLKGVVSGIGSRALGDILNRDTFSDPSSTLRRLENDTFNSHAMLADAATWTLGEGLFHGGNYFSGVRLGQNPLLRGMTMGATFGAVNGTDAEIAKEKAANQSLDLAKIVQQGLIEAAISGAAAGTGMGLSAPGESVHISQAGDAKAPIDQAKMDNLRQMVLNESGVSISTGTNAETGKNGGKPAQVVDLASLKAAYDGSKARPQAIPSDILGETPVPGIRSMPPPPPQAREFVIDSSAKSLKNLRNRQADDGFIGVREKLKDVDGKESLGPKKLLYVQKLGTGEKVLKAAAEKADLVVTSHPEVLSAEARAKHIFPDGEGKVWLAMGGKGGKGDILRLGIGDVQLGQWKQEGFVDPVRLDSGNVSLSAMAPLLVGDPHDMDSPASQAAWKEFDQQLATAKTLGIDAISTDVWWGLIQPTKGEFNWQYYERLSQHIIDAKLKWVPILSFHQCGGNVGDTAYEPLPAWVWADVASRASNGDVEAVKYKSEQGHTSPEYVSLFADHAVMENYANVMKEFQQHFADRAKDIGEVNVSLGPAGELRYPSYNAHDTNTGYPTRGALQSYSPLAIESFRQYVDAKYGGHDAVGKAWGIENLDDSHILPPSDATGFFGRGDHFNTQYGRDFIDWYSQSLVDHGQRMLSTAVSVFGQKGSSFYGIDIGAKVPGVHWRIGEWQGNNIVLSDRLAEIDAGLIRTSLGDWDKDADGRGYRPIFSMFKSLQPITPGIGSRIVPGFTCLEMPDGDGGPSVKAMPHSLATWAGQEAERQGLWLKGENALNGNLYNNNSWDLMRGFLTLPNQHGLYHGLTFLRLQDIVSSDVARNRVSQINSARNAFELMTQSLRRMFARTA